MANEVAMLQRAKERMQKKIAEHQRKTANILELKEKREAEFKKKHEVVDKKTEEINHNRSLAVEIKETFAHNVEKSKSDLLMEKKSTAEQRKAEGKEHYEKVMRLRKEAEEEAAEQRRAIQGMKLVPRTCMGCSQKFTMACL